MKNDKDYPEFSVKFGNRMANIRRQQGITQVQLAKTLGITQQSVASYEVGRRKLPLHLLHPVSKALSVSLQDLLGVKNNSRRGPSSKLHKQVEKIRQLPKSKQKIAMDMLDTVLKSASKG